MAPRRALFSSASRASAAIRPARPIFIVAARSISPSLPSRAFAPFPSIRSYATKAQTKTKSIDDNAPPESKPWSFEDIKNHVEKSDPGNVVLIEPVELFETGKIPGAINIPITSAAQSFHISDEDFEDMYGFQRPAKNKELVFYCKAGVRARAAAQLAHHAGWDKIGDYAGSWLDWEAQKGPVEKVKKRY
ncbi:heat shock 67B2 [Fusarium pseudoanthophilum]|uniref:Heat shock 67B2 n=1 Tax=Fusarium pseudoanthophilum TaxID=48495 RepID=A0A8H5KZA0_9HYPO|nr:heat shock 67B2 [Fusarium pseudoanthophilum]